MRAVLDYLVSHPASLGALIFVLITLLCTLLLCSYTYRITFKRRKRELGLYEGFSSESHGGHGERMRAMVKALADEPCETVQIRAKDGTWLRCRYYERRKGAPLQVQFHGYRSHPVRDFSGGGGFALRSGYNLALVYQRAHGESEGRSISFGVRESEDAVEWLNYFANRCGNVPIFAVGISMGAATVLLAGAKELPECVKGIIADCPYSDAESIIKRVAGKMGFPPRLVYPFIRLGGRIFGGFDVNLSSPIKAVKDWRVPVLLIHGEDDGFVPCSMSDRIHAEAKKHGQPIKYLTFKGADHGMSYIVDQERYEKEIVCFLSKLTNTDNE